MNAISPSLNKIVFVSTIPPTQCGIATYTADTIAALSRIYDAEVQYEICEIRFETNGLPTESPYVIYKSNLESYVEAAVAINEDDAVNLVHIQHEFGLFGGEYGTYLFDFLKILQKPVVFTFHSVLPVPNAKLQWVVQELCNYAASVSVMTDQSKSILIEDYAILADKISIVPHGTHFVTYEKTEKVKKSLGLANRPILSTFGLLGEGKSIETALQALPQIVEQFPDVLYLIIGKTHPHRIIDGVDVYRNYLEKLVSDLDLSENVTFIADYLETEELLEYLKATDIYLFTSKDPNQAVSGTFSYAMSCSCPIVASKIPHTVEVLDDGLGILVDIQQSNQFASAVVELLKDNNRLEQMSLNAYAKSIPTSWENIALKQMKWYASVSVALENSKFNLPPVRWEHINATTDSNGLLQFSNITEPDYGFGYTLDDNARALVSLSLLYKNSGDEKVLSYLLLYLNFIERCQLDTGDFFNYVDQHNRIDPRNYDENLEDANGRAIWGLGTLISSYETKTASFVAQAMRCLIKALPSLYQLRSPRALAFSIKGLYAAYQIDNDIRILRVIDFQAQILASLYKTVSTPHWKWFEDKLTYANAVLPEAMLLASELFPSLGYHKIATNSMEFLCQKMISDGNLKVISNRGWYERGTIPNVYGEQPIDACYLIQALDSFYRICGDEIYHERIVIAFEWFLGRNHLNQIMYNPLTGGCFDGLEQNNVNLNQGAESSVCYLMARLTIAPYFEKNQNVISLHPEDTERESLFAL